MGMTREDYVCKLPNFADVFCFCDEGSECLYISVGRKIVENGPEISQRAHSGRAVLGCFLGTRRRYVGATDSGRAVLGSIHARLLPSMCRLASRMGAASKLVGIWSSFDEETNKQTNKQKRHVPRCSQQLCALQRLLQYKPHAHEHKRSTDRGLSHPGATPKHGLPCL